MPSFFPNPVTILDTIGNPVTTLPQFMLVLVDLVFLVAMPIIVVFIIYSGFLFVTAGGNEQRIAKARTNLTWTLIGAFVLLSAKAMALAISATLLSLR